MTEQRKAKRLSTDRVRGGERRPEAEAPKQASSREADVRPRAPSADTSSRTVTG